ncbi:alpha/beta hydrolase [Phytomonospora sp. NPDC050363]|uniref:alpha/beta fold hydrolase n=1 Tax=Phytomonospora sp. NPDC050363 TaxID=3155642 RepID=UPI0033C77072
MNNASTASAPSVHFSASTSSASTPAPASVPAAAGVLPSLPIGGYAEVGGRRIFVHRAGDAAGPAVVFLPGASAIGLDYFGLQQRVAGFATAVVYDRAGTGFSDDAPLPRSGEAVVTELHEVLASQGIESPYVLVAHSLGGAFAHRFAQLFPDDVAGLVWVDAFHRDWDAFLPVEAGLAAGEELAPSAEQLEQALPLMRDMIAAMFADYPEAVRDAVVDYHVSRRWITAGIAERGQMVSLAEELHTGPQVPDVPVIALTPVGVDPAQQSLMSEEVMQAVHDGKVRLDAALVASVSNGEQRILSDTNHSQIIVDRADAVVQAVRDVIDRAGR